MDEPAHVHELIADAQRGGRRGLDAFNTLVLSYQSQVYNVAYRILGEEAGAADATQDTFISAFKHIRKFRNASVSGSFKSFLLRTVTNACFDTLRYDKRRPTTSLDGLGEDAHDDGGEYNTNEFLPSSAAAPIPKTVPQPTLANTPVTDAPNTVVAESVLPATLAVTQYSPLPQAPRTPQLATNGINDAAAANAVATLPQARATKSLNSPGKLLPTLAATAIPTALQAMLELTPAPTLASVAPTSVNSPVSTSPLSCP
jgi:RNA polymerase sigma factor (sigma-70 family)